MAPFLSSQLLSASAPAKVILVGEHSVLYGYQALAVALPDVTLTVEILAPRDSSSPSSWRDAWEIMDRSGATIEKDSALNDTLFRCLEAVPVALGWSWRIEDFSPQTIRVRSSIPLGAGMGGSAALSVALFRLFSGMKKHECHTFSDQVRVANRLDSVFHGSASGVDVSAILHGGVLQFSSEKGCESVAVGREFWLVIADSGTRSRTIDMVERVRQRRVAQQRETEEILANLGSLADRSISLLANGDLNSLGAALSAAHGQLRDLGLSSQELEEAIADLRQAGAIGAKLTGAGGGGMALGLFSERPEPETLRRLSRWNVLLTRIGAT